MTTLTQAPTYLILGAGCFGASTAYHLITEYSNAQITLIDRGPFPNPTAAAHDLNKIIRADYPDLVYMRLAHESQEQWRYEPLFRPFYHETGMLFVEDFGMGRKTYDNHKKLFGEKSSAELLDPDVAQQSFDGVFKTAHWTGVKKNYYNPRSGWAEADKAMTALIQAAVDRGVRYLGDGVAKLLFDDNSKCTGVLTGNGQVLHADRIVLAAGASIAQLLADSAPRNKDLQVNGRQIAAAATSCYLFVPENRRQRLKNAPVVFNGLDHTHGESVPLTPDGYLKFNFETSFTNFQLHRESGQMISMPPSRRSQSVWSQDVPEELKEKVQTAVKHIYGKEVEGLPIKNYRMCWDAVTPNQDWIISPHPHSENLFIVGGGSFHAWKFLPTIGKYVVQMLDGRLEDQLTSKWAWNRNDHGAACEMYIPRRDLKDMRGYEES